MTLKSKFISITLLLSLVPLMVFGMIAYQSAKTGLEEKIGSGLLALAQAGTDRLDRTLHERLANVTAWSSLGSLQDIMIDDDDGRIAAELERLKADYGVYQEIYVANASGSILAVSGGEPPEEAVSEADWFQKTLAGDVDVRDVRRSSLTSELAMAFSSPVRADYNKNKIIGVLSARFDWSRIHQLIESIKINGREQNEEALVLLVNRAGQVISGPEFLVQQGSVFNLDLSAHEAVRLAREGRQGYLIEQILDQEMLVGFAPLAAEGVFAELGWALLTLQDTRQAFAEVAALKLKIFGVLGVTLLLVLAITLPIAGRFVRPIKKVASLTRRIADGDLDVKIDYQSRDELGTLAEEINRMSAKLCQRAELAEKIANGDLSQEVELLSPKDKLGKALGTMTGRLRQMLAEISDAAEQIAAGSGQVADTSQTLSSGSTQQSSSLQQVSSSLVEMTDRVRNNAASADQANQFSTQTKEAAEKGRAEMEAMEIAMAEINTSSQDISRIIKTIDEIAFQTNLLALNAAVEAARAGHHGKGFAVVAEEVRNLAARSAKAASETTELIEGSVQKTENGAAIVTSTATALHQIIAGITSVSDLIGKIASASHNQAEGISQVSQSLTQIEEVTLENTGTSEESAAAAEELSSQADQLRQMLRQFKLQNDSSALHQQHPSDNNSAQIT